MSASLALSSAASLPSPVRTATWLFLLLVVILGLLLAALLLTSLRRWATSRSGKGKGDDGSTGADPWAEAGHRMKPYDDPAEEP